MSEFNVMEHQLVPEHRLLSDKEAKVVLKKYRITASQLPKIRKDDSGLQFLERVEGEIAPGRVILIRRYSEISGVVESYRVVVPG